jgi:hypothetical protein
MWTETYGIFEDLFSGLNIQVHQNPLCSPVTYRNTLRIPGRTVWLLAHSHRTLPRSLIDKYEETIESQVYYNHGSFILCF